MPKPPAHLTIVSGAESLLVVRAIKATVADVRKVVPSIQRDDLDAEETESAGRLLNALSPSLFGEPAIIVIRDLADASDALVTSLLTGLADLAEDIWVIAVHSGSRNKKALDALRKVKVRGGTSEVVCAEVKAGAPIKALLESEARVAGRRITPDGITALVAAFGPNASLLVGALEQLVTDNPEGPVTASMVSETFPWMAKVTPYKMVDAILEGRGDEAMEQLRIGLDTGSLTGPFVVDVLARAMRQMALVSGAPRGMRDDEIAQMAGIPPFKVRSVQSLARQWGPTRIADAIIELADLDAAVKGGLRKGESLEPAQKDAALEVFVMRLTQPD